MDYIKKELINDVLQRAIQNNEIAGGSLLVLKHGEELFYAQKGYADIETNTLIQRDTIFRLYSMSKPITAVAAMILMERGKIDLMDPVCRYLKGFKNQKFVNGNQLEPLRYDMNIKELLNMTSGLLYGGETITGKETIKVFDEIDQRLFTDYGMTTVEFANKLGQIPLAFHPGDSWSYGTSADVLGAVIEVASGKKFADFLRDELFEPLGMMDTDFYVPEDKQYRLAKTYETTEQGLVLYQGNHLGIINKMDRSPNFQSGGAGLVSTIDDYAKFAAMLINGGTIHHNTILRKNTVTFLTTQVLDSMQSVNFRNWHTLGGYSYGNLMRIGKNPELGGGIISLGEYGWDGWLGCYFANMPKEDTTILIMMQKKDGGTTSLTRKLRNIILS